MPGTGLLHRKEGNDASARPCDAAQRQRMPAAAKHAVAKAGHLRLTPIDPLRSFALALALARTRHPFIPDFPNYLSDLTGVGVVDFTKPRYKPVSIQ